MSLAIVTTILILQNIQMESKLLMRCPGLLPQSNDFLAVKNCEINMSDVWLPVTQKTSTSEFDTAGEEIGCWWHSQGRGVLRFKVNLQFIQREVKTRLISNN